MSSSSSEAANARPGKRKAADSNPNESSVSAVRAKACTSCRQAKLKCDSAETFPAPCSRCKTRDLDCRMDSNFKRIPTRHKLEEVTSQLNSLQEALKARSDPQKLQVHPSEVRDSRTVSPDVVAGLVKLPSITVDNTRIEEHTVELTFYGIEDSVNSALSIGEQTLGNTTLTGLAVVHLFDHYCKNYYHIGPELDTSPSLSELYSHSQILFWTIIITSIRYHPDYSFLYKRLVTPYEQLLSTYLVRPILVLSTLHAILILCYWPLQVPVQVQDPLWNYLGLVTNAATQLGLHRPGDEREFGFPRATSVDVELRVKTWLHIFLLNTIVSTRIGVPSLLDRESNLRDISRFCDVYLPSGSALSIRSEIQRISAKSSAALQGQEDEESRLTLILMFNAELDEIGMKSRKTWNPETEFRFLGAKLFLLGWSFPYQTQPDITFDGGAKPPTSRRLILHDAMRVSLKMIHEFCDLRSSKRDSHPLVKLDKSPPTQVYQPKVDFFTFYYAIATLYLFLSHFPSPSPSDTDLALNHIRNAHSLLTRCACNDEKHEWARMAFNVELMGKWHASGRRLPPEAAIRSRMGASLFYDGRQKIAVLKAEKGGRSYTTDLTQPLPDREERGRKASLIGDEDVMESLHPGANVSKTEADVATLGVQEGPLDRTGLWPGWDDSIWGWDLNMVDTSFLEMDGEARGIWQP